MAFYEGGMTFTELCEMPLSEFFEIVDCANTIAGDRKREMEKARGK